MCKFTTYIEEGSFNIPMALMVCNVLALITFAMLARGGAQPRIPAIYVFGDSTIDVGNNDYLPGSGNVNFRPYGIDFPGSQPTGRYSNGYNAADFIAQHMGFPRSPPPFLSLNNKTSLSFHAILKTGVSFASGGSGILDTTGPNSLTMTQQIKYFSAVRSDLVTQIGLDETNKLLSMSIFLVSSGGNDVFAFSMDHFFANNATRKLFYDAMTSKYKEHVEELYNLGARKFAIVNVPAVGCIPIAVAIGFGSCIDAMNEGSLGVNTAYSELFQAMTSRLQGMKYSIGSSYTLLQNIISHPEDFGFTEVKSACCGYGICHPNATYCEERNQYLFWDGVHPTQAAAKLAGLNFYNGSSEVASPINFKMLANADAN